MILNSARRTIFLIFCLLFMSCSSLKLNMHTLSEPAKALIHEVSPDLIEAVVEHNLRNGTALAKAQDSLMALYIKGDTIGQNTLDSLENNLWIKASARICPSNLVIRQWCLVDLFKKKPDHTAPIRNMVELLSYEAQSWAEGYSYWCYTKDFIIKWLNEFENNEIRHLVRLIDRSFALTCYYKGLIAYPAPYGDLRDETLRVAPEHTFEGRVAIIEITRKDTIKYKIYGEAIGLNTHIPIDTTKIKIVDGIPAGFKFYQGYDKKYSSKEEELLDIFHPLRVRSAEKLLKEK